MLERNLRFALLTCAAVLLAAVAAPWAHAAETVHLYLRDMGGDIQGESTQQSMGRANSIECVQFEMVTAMAREGGAGMATGRLATQPVRIVKRIDKSSPRLAAAMAAGADLAGCMFRFFRPNPTGDGTTEQFYTITLAGARIISIRQFVPNCLLPATSSDPPQEEILIAYRSAEWTYANGNIKARVGMGQTSPQRPPSRAARRTSPAAPAPRRPSTARLARTASR